MDKARMVVLFNEWMKRYIEDPEKFGREFRSVIDFAAAESSGKVPSYGDECVAYLSLLDSEVPA